jgi:hypothetical protein
MRKKQQNKKKGKNISKIKNLENNTLLLKIARKCV